MFSSVFFRSQYLLLKACTHNGLTPTKPARMLYIILAIGFLIFLYFKLREPAWSKNIPGMPCWPVIGNMLQINPTHPHVTFQEWAKQIGKIFKVRLLGEIQLIVSDYDAAHEILVKKSTDFAGRVSMYRSKVLTRGNKNISFHDFTPEYVLMKKMFMTGIRLGQGVDGNIEHAALSCATELIEKFKTFDGKPVDIREDIRQAILKVIVTLGFGIKLTDNDTRLAQLSEMETKFMAAITFAGEGIAMDFFPWIRFFSGKTAENMKKAAYYQETILRNMLEETKNLRAAGNSERCILDPILTEYDKQIKEGKVLFTPNQLLMAASDIVIGGLVTTSVLIYHMVNLMLHYPRVLKKVQEEVDEMTPKGHSVVLQDRPRMPYTQAVILEALRHISHVSLGMPHKTTKDTSIGNIFVPKGTTVMVNIWALHHDEEFWEKPYELYPERFIDQDGNLVGPEHENRKRLLAFSAGRRVCPGELLALIRAFLFFTNLVKTFHLLPPEDTPLVSCDPRSKGFGVGAIVMPPTFKIRLVPR